MHASSPGLLEACHRHGSGPVPDELTRCPAGGTLRARTLVVRCIAVNSPARSAGRLSGDVLEHVAKGAKTISLRHKRHNN